MVLNDGFRREINTLIPFVTALPHPNSATALTVLKEAVETGKIERPFISAVTAIRSSDLSMVGKKAHFAILGVLEEFLLNQIVFVPDVKELLQNRLGKTFSARLSEDENVDYRALVKHFLDDVLMDNVNIRFPLLHYLLTGDLDLPLSRDQIAALARVFDKWLIEDRAPLEVLVRFPTTSITLESKVRGYLKTKGDLRLENQIFSFLKSLRTDQLIDLLKERWVEETGFSIPIMLYFSTDLFSPLKEVFHAYQLTNDLVRNGDVKGPVVLLYKEPKSLKNLLTHYEGPLRYLAEDNSLILGYYEIHDRVVRIEIDGAVPAAIATKLPAIRELSIRETPECTEQFVRLLPNPHLLQNVTVKTDPFDMEWVDPLRQLSLNVLAYLGCKFVDAARALTREVEILQVCKSTWENPDLFANEFRNSDIAVVKFQKLTLPLSIAEALGESASLRTLEMEDVRLDAQAISALMKAPNLCSFTLLGYYFQEKSKLEPVRDALMRGVLKELTLSYLDLEKVSVLVDALRHHSSLEIVRLQTCNVAATNTLLGALSLNPTLTSLRYLQVDYLDANGIEMLLNIRQQNPNVKFEMKYKVKRLLSEKVSPLQYFLMTS